MRRRSTILGLLPATLAALAIASPAVAARHHPLILRSGDRGAAVRQLQRRLHIRQTGFFGIETVRTVERYQWRHGLMVDGEVGPITHHSLHAGWVRHVSRLRARRARSVTRGRLGAQVLHLGSEGPAVVELQRLLHVRADGIFGPRTRAAVVRFQRAHRLPGVGWVGPHTRAALAASTRRVHRGRRAHRGRVHPRHRRAAGPSVLRYGMRGVRIAMLQVRLGAAADGVFGPAMLATVERFQAAHGLVVDGEVGPETLRALHDSARGHDPAVWAAVEAVREVGRPYVLGGATAHGFDCSGLVMWAYAHAGVSLPRTSYEQFRAARTHPRLRSLRTGDLVFFHARSHVGIYLGHGLLVRAPRPGTRVGIAPLAGWFLRHWSGAGRVAA